MKRLFIILALAFTVGPALEAREKVNTSTKAGGKKKRKAKVAGKAGKQGQFGVGVGLFNFYPPQPSLEGLWRQDNVVVSAEAGVFNLNVGELTGKTSYFGASGRYLLTPTFFAGLGLGRRHIIITTEADMVVNGTSHPIKWTRTTDQMVATPKVGWDSFSNRSTAFVFSCGLLVPFGTRFTVTRNVESISDLPDEELDKEEKKKADDVRKITTVVMPYFEMKYHWFF